jgi:hypothetical protein
MTAEIIDVRDLVVSADHGQIYIYSHSDDPGIVGSQPDVDNPYLVALDDGVRRGTFVGVYASLIDLMTPGQPRRERSRRGPHVLLGEGEAAVDGVRGRAGL